MDLSDEINEEDLKDYFFNEIRNDLNLDDETLQDAWNTYRRIGVNCLLEGKKMDWLACALYASCRKCVTQTIGKQGKIEGNLVSLTRILRSCNISLVRFFTKMKNWLEMANQPIEMKNKLDQLERNFNVTSVIFKKYKPIFEDIFKCPSQMPCRFMPKNRKQIRKQALNSLDIFTFCWTLFTYIKSRFSQISDDLVNSYHLLLVCMDYCFSSVLSFDNYKDIVNNNFYDALTRELKTDARSHNNDNRVSIIDILCSKWHGISIEVKQIKKHWFKPLLKNLIENEDLRKRANGIIDSDVVDFNYKFFKREYENFVLTIGDFDECVFLNETASEELGTSELQSADLEEKLFSRFQRIHHDQPNNLMPMTPLSSKQYLASRTPVNKTVPLTPISSATTSISRLQSILIKCKNEPSEDLEKLFKICKNNPKNRIAEIINGMGDIFLKAYCNDCSNQSLINNTEEYQYIITAGDEFAKKRLHLAVTFFYNILEKILKSELRKRIPESQLHQDLTKIVETDIFIRSLFACSLEIVLFSYSLCKRVFPWILTIFDGHPNFAIHPFYFYKIIEPIIRDEQDLSRDIVKHLNKIEEKILDSLAWTHDSPIWTLLSKIHAPNCSEVSLSIFNTEKRSNGVSFISSPAIKSEYNNSIMNAFSYTNHNISAKRQLVFNTTNEAIANKSDNIKILPYLLQVKNENGQVQYYSTDSKNNCIQVVPRSPNPVLSNCTVKEEIGNVDSTQNSNQVNSVSKSPVQNENMNTEKVQKNGQLNLFFRKVYSLASLRLRDLCKGLNISLDDIQLKIWTCLEHALSVHTDLMCDHHLDQLIMCSIYAVCKVNKFEDKQITFQNIIKYYRLQPQAINNVYRDVLIVPRKLNESNSDNTSCSPVVEESIRTQTPLNGVNQPAIPKDTNTEVQVKKHGNIIDFYNSVFIQKLTQAYICKFSSEKNSPPLSPMPPNKFSSPIRHSPHRRVLNSVFVSPLRNSNYPPSPNKAMMCRFQNNLNSSKDLKIINNIMKSSANSIPSGNANHNIMPSIATAMVMQSLGMNSKNVSKRILQDDQESDSSQNKIFCSMNRKIADIVNDRHLISASSSANASATEDSNDSIQYPNNATNIGLNIATINNSLTHNNDDRNANAAADHDDINNNCKNVQVSPKVLVIDDNSEPVIGRTNGQSTFTTDLLHPA